MAEPNQAPLSLLNRLYERPFFCQPCTRSFKSAANLDAHLRSRTHRPPVWDCECCSKLFVAFSALVFHWETSVGRNGHPSKTVDECALLIYKELGRRFSIVDERYVRTEGDVKLPPLPVDIASSIIPQVSKYKCRLCSSKFKAYKDIEAHLSSPAHKAKMYMCPSSPVGCGKKFTTLSGLLQHLEPDVANSPCNMVRDGDAKILIHKIFRQLRTLGRMNGSPQEDFVEYHDSL